MFLTRIRSIRVAKGRVDRHRYHSDDGNARPKQKSAPNITKFPYVYALDQEHLFFMRLKQNKFKQVLPFMICDSWFGAVFGYWKRWRNQSEAEEAILPSPRNF